MLETKAHLRELCGASFTGGVKLRGMVTGAKTADQNEELGESGNMKYLVLTPL
jgi:hypothetical protein